MSDPLSLLPAVPSLLAVDRAIAELRRGGAVTLSEGDQRLTRVLAAETVTAESLLELSDPLLVVTGRRAHVLGVWDDPHPVVSLTAATPFSASRILELIAPIPGQALGDVRSLTAAPLPETSGAAAAVALAKLARLLPAVVVAPLREGRRDPFQIATQDVFDYQHNAARTLRLVSEARVPLRDAENTRILAFRPADGGMEHLAIVIGELDKSAPVLARLHSECFTGDLIGSLRCDCGDQLRGAIAEIANAGSGILLYLAQEGRGIGLVNKLRAYQLQDAGFDTLDANLQLGFDDDERIYQPAVHMLRLLGIRRVRLMTNNPEKVSALAAHGVEVVERVPHVFPANDHNEDYLLTKATRGGHLF